MSLFSIVGLYETLALEGSYRGIGFAYEPADDEAGRRIEGFMFPGQDATAFQDLGQYDGDIVVHGIVSGDDYAHQVTRLRQALQTPGPGMLVHPWLGSFLVVQSPGKMPKFDFKQDELRIARFTATFRRYSPAPKPSPDTLQGLLDSLSDMRTAAYGMLAKLLAPVALTLSAVSQVEALAGEVATILGSLVTACVDPLVGIAGALPIGALSGIGDLPYDGTYAGAAGALLAAPSAAIAATSAPAIPAAVAPGGTAATPVPVDGRVTAALLLSAASGIGAASLTGAPVAIAPGPALILSAQLFAVADAVSAASTIGYASQQEAASWSARVAAAIDALVPAAAALVPAAPAPAAAMWRALAAARAAWVADMSALAGRLPAVVTFTPPGLAPAWVMAQYLAGDDPAQVIATYRDLIARNGIFHPAAPPPGPLEVLE